MGFSIQGYILEKPRVGTSNSPFTLTPDNLISNQGAFDARFPPTETEPRAEYLVMVLADGDLAEAEFGWTRNDDIQRFYWEGRDQRFRSLPGSTPSEVGNLSGASNTTRLKVTTPSASLVTCPIRLAVGSVGIGTDFTVQTVATDASFTTPPQGVVQLSLVTGNLNWNSADLSSYDGQKVYFQRQQFFTTKESSGRVGVIPPSGSPTILLNPIPNPGSHPLVRVGFGLWLSAIEVSVHSSNPTQGTVEWQSSTGLLKFNSQDLNNNRGAVTYYDGLLLARRLFLAQQAVGTVAAPTSLSTVPTSGGDVLFRAISTVASGAATFSQSNVLATAASLVSVAINDVVVLTSGAFAGVRRRITSIGAGTLTVAPPFPARLACSFRVEHNHTQFSETLRYSTLAGSTVPSSGQVAYDDSGQVATSLSDQGLYTTTPLVAVVCDLPVEHGVSMRFFRTPVDSRASAPDLKDVSAFYSTSGAILMDPLIGTPFVSLPIVPVDDSAYPLTVRVAQGTGSYPAGIISRLDVGTPSPTAVGYGVDFEQRQVNLVARKNNVTIPLLAPTGAVQLPDPLVDPDNAVLELDTGAGFSPLTVDEDVLFDAQSGVARFIEKFGATLAFGTVTSFNGASLVDNEQDFTSAGVQAGDLLLVPSGAAEGVYTIVSAAGVALTVTPAASSSVVNSAYEIRRGREVLADRYFQEVLLTDPALRVERIRPQLTTAANSPRQAIPVGYVGVSGIRLGQGDFPTIVVVQSDAAFTIPSTGTVQISAETGHLNFAGADFGKTWFWVRRLVEKKDFRLEPVTGLIQTVERLLSNDELRVTYRPFKDGTSDPDDTITERATFLVRKEIATNQLPSRATFNKFSKTVAVSPAPSVFRGGRPQDSGQVDINTTTATLTFLPDTQVTDALPHGSVLGASERVMVDYYVYEALGGENTTTVTKPPMYVVSVYTLNPNNGARAKGLVEGSSSFVVAGDRRSQFPTDHLLRVGKDECYFLAAPTYNASTDETTVNLLAPQMFRNDNSQPQMFVSSGPVPVSTYFALEPAFDLTSGALGLPRGMDKLRLPGDRTSAYLGGTVVYLSAPGAPASQDVYIVHGAAFDAATNETTVTITNTTARQYNPLPGPSGAIMRRSVRPVYDSVAKTAQSSKAVILEKGFVIYRQVEGQVGQILAYVPPGGKLEATDLVKIDDVGQVTFKDPLLPNEEFSLLYTGYALVTGVLRASYTFGIVPNSTNGLENQRLLADFTAYAPDTFFYRVETLKNFRAEVAEQYKDNMKSSVPSGGPTMSNSAQTPLFKQGAESAFFEEGRLSNEDIVARSILKFYNDAVNYLEDALRAIDGRVVGDKDGRFLFDGSLNNPVRASFAQVTNQIDDRLVVSPFPLPGGTTQAVYKSGPYSRFYSTRRNLFAGPTIAGSEDGDPIAKFAFKNLASLPGEARRRAPRAHILKSYAAGTTTFEVDNAVGTTDALLRPAFQTNMRVVVEDAQGNVYINDAAEVKVIAVGAGSPNTLTLSGGSGSVIPAGATIYLASGDASSVLSDGSQSGYAMVYRFGKEIDANLETGELLFIKRAFPFDGTLPTTFIPKILLINEVPAGDILQCNGAGVNNTDTAPYKFPALYGGTADDDGDQAVPIVGPKFDGELTLSGSGPLNLELAAILPVTGEMRTKATAPYVGTGSLNPACTIITDVSNYISPLPKVHDLVRILSGANGATSFRRITAVGANSITVESAFSTQDSGFAYTIAVGSLSIVGTATTSGTGTTFTDASGAFTMNGTQVGHTVTLTSGPDVGRRRQVVSVNSATQITLDTSFPTATQTATYQVDNPLATYNGVSVEQLSSALANEVASLSMGQQAALVSFLSTVFTTEFSGTGGVVTISNLAQLTDSSVNYLTAGITAGQYVYVPSGPAMGVYKIASVDSATQLTTESPFFAADSGFSYQVVSAFGASLPTFEDIIAILRANEGFLSSTLTFEALVDSPVAVLAAGVVDSTAASFTRGYLYTDLNLRTTAVQSRLSYLTDPALGPTVKVEKALKGTERLYDKRYVWIDARINVEKGLLPSLVRAIENRMKKQVETVNQLIKLLAV